MATTLPSWVSSVSQQLSAKNTIAGIVHRTPGIPNSVVKASSLREVFMDEKGSPIYSGSSKRRMVLFGLGTLTTTSILPASYGSAQEVPEKYSAFVDTADGYKYYYPSDWRDFDFRGHDSAFKDRTAQLQHVRVFFIPTEKKDIRDLGPMEEVIFDLVKNVYAAPTQIPTIYDIQERTIDGKNYWTFEYELQSTAFARTAFATIAIGNGRYYTLVVGANQRRWSRVRNQLKVVADSFKILDI